MVFELFIGLHDGATQELIYIDFSLEEEILNKTSNR